MSFNQSSALELLRINNYSSLVLITAVLYDYVLTLPREIDHIWSKHWTQVSTMFVIVRYIGLCWAMLNGFVSSTFVPGPQTVSAHMRLAAAWQFPIFFNAADFVMVLRVYAMWARSKRILIFLLSIFVPQVIVSFVFVGVYDNPKTHYSATVAQFSGITYCRDEWRDMPPLVNLYDGIPRFILSSALLVLALIRTVKVSFTMYGVTKKWQINQCMERLVKDGILYFFINVAFNVAYAFQRGFTITTDDNFTILLNLFCNLTICFMMPRFIINVRELSGSTQQGVDTGFGVEHGMENSVISNISFAQVKSSQTLEYDDEDGLEMGRLRALGDNAGRV